MSQTKDIGTSEEAPLHSPIRSKSSASHAFPPGTDGCAILPAEMVGTREVTDHARAEYVLIQQMASVQHLARELAHDFRNMLLSIASLVVQLEKAQPTDIVTGKTQAIRNVLMNLEEMVNHLHSIGTPDGGGPARVVQDLSLELARLVESMRPSMEGGVDLRFIPCSCALPVMVTRGILSRIAGNLITNGRDAMPCGGEIEVSLQHRRLDLDYCRAHGNARPGTFGVLRVDDQGSGIPPEILPRIFEPLFSTKTANGSGDGCKRGWGLATVYALVTSHDGWIDVETHPGLGTRFEVFLPLCDEVSRMDAS